jgi:hypothetical protein
MRLASRSTVLEEENTTLKKQLSDANNERLSQADIFSTEAKIFKSAANSTILELRTELTVAKSELEAANDLIKSKDAEIQRLSASILSDENRLESKLRFEVFITICSFCFC